MTAFELIAKLTADTSGFDSAMAKAGKSGKTLQGSLENTFGKIKKVAASALSVAAIKKGIDTLVEFANEVSQAGERIDKQSQALGLSRKAYQEWDYILGQNGASIDSLGVSMKTLNSLVLDAAAGGEESKNAFAQLGLGIHEIEQLEPEKQFEAVVRAFQKMPAGAQKSALAVKIFGRNGMELLPLLNQSETSIDELRARAEELGLIMSDDAVDAAVVYGDSLDDLQRTFNSLKYSIGSKILPTLTSGIQKVTNYAAKLRKAYEDNGLAGVWDTLVSSFKNIQWPTQEEIIGKISEMWEGVKTAAKNVLKLVFGESADGDIDWPTPEEIEQKVKTGLTDMWEGVKTFASSVMKLFFGESDDGGINFPTPAAIWLKIKDTVTNIWSFVKSAASGILKFAFGETEDGGIAFPTAAEVWGKIKGAFESWWDNLRGLIEEKLKFVLGVPELPDAHEAGEMLRGKLTEWWETIKGAVASVFSWFLPDPEMEDADGTGMLADIQTWWDEKIKPALKDALNFVLGLFGLPDVDEMKAKVEAWWQDTVTAFKDSITYTLGLFGLPSYEEMKEKILAWWESVKTAVGDLVLNIIPNILGLDNAGGVQTTSTTGTALDTPQNNQRTMDTMFGSLFGHAKGLNYVPYDNYPALLHRGEQVLTASAARRNRGGGSTGIDTGAIASAVSSAIRSAMEGVSVNSYLSGKDITDNVDRDMARKLKARRFAT